MNPEIYIEQAYGPINLSPKSVSVQHTITGKLIKILAINEYLPAFNRERSIPPDVQEKMVYNNIVSEKWAVLKYTGYGEAVENAYLEIETEIVNGKTKALSKLNDFYLQAMARFGIDLQNIDLIKLRAHSDEIFKLVISTLRDYLLDNDSSLSNLSHEELDTGISLIVAHGFVECLVLEEPK